MGHLVFDFQININAKPEDVFAYVADFSKHSEWTEGLSMEAISDGPIAEGSEYESTGRQLGKDVKNRIKITEYKPSTNLSFSAYAGEQKFMQEMKFSESNGGTLLVRTLSFEANPILSILFKTLIGPMVANPSMRKTLKNLKAQMES